jgi:adenosylcobinamide-GDP ribazoletransferase
MGRFNLRRLSMIWQQGLGAIAFYTCIPIPPRWPIAFNRIARWAPLVGIGIGASLGGVNVLLDILGMPPLVRSSLVVSVWIALTGGLHLDGAMDTADGLAVMEPGRRLEVMADSRSGAFGGMAVVLLWGLKTSALFGLSPPAFGPLMLATTWGRWGQLWAIACYPYLKPAGKGAIHKNSLCPGWDLGVGSAVVLGLTAGQLWQYPQAWIQILAAAVAGLILATGLGAWLNHQLGGQTGDTYGAIVEWTEALLLCLLTVLWVNF